MAIVKPFICIRPDTRFAAEVAALPYDVYDRKEAKAAVIGKPLLFLNIDRPETQYDDEFDMYSDKAYETARDMLAAQIENGIFITDTDASYYVYELTMEGRTQTGIVACCSVDDYKKGIIKKHENTRREKEEDRVRHISTVGAQTGPIFLAYRENARLNEIISEVKKAPDLYDFVSDDGIRHHVWKIGSEYTKEIEEIFEHIDSIYIADGHHRAASAVRVGSDEGFMSVLFADSQLKIMAYNRAVKDLNGLSSDEFFDKIKNFYEVTEASDSVMPDGKGIMGMYAGGKWYKLTLKKEFENTDPVDGLDVSRLQDLILAPVLGIEDPRTDDRISFVGGIRGNKELERLVNECGYAVAFSMYPTQMSELLAVADAKLLMPPKSTWFEPKLRSGLFIHKI